jgi:hypothetical protein
MISTRLAWNEPVGRQRRARIEEPKLKLLNLGIVYWIKGLRFGSKSTHGICERAVVREPPPH